MTCCKGTATWFCCYPDHCGCDCGGCQTPNSNCSNPICYPTSYNSGCTSGYCGGGGCGSNPPPQTKGSCCICNSSGWGYAWNCGTCGMCPGCNSILWFTKDCMVYDTAHRYDTGPGSSALVDFTKSLFMDFAPLCQGVINNMKATNDVTCC